MTDSPSLKQEIYDVLRQWHFSDLDDKYDDQDLEDMTDNIMNVIEKYYPSASDIYFSFRPYSSSS